MRLTLKELDGLLSHQAGFLAQKRLARGLRLNHPEATALLACQVRFRQKISASLESDRNTMVELAYFASDPGVRSRRPQRSRSDSQGSASARFESCIAWSARNDR